MARVRSVVVGVILVVVSAGCGGAPQASSREPASRPKADASAPKAASSPAPPMPSPTPDPAGRTDPVDGACPPSHQIKGATSPAGERLYYEPDRPSYPTVTPEVCFTAGGDARGAGYRSYRQ
jgi:hypothetical protein